MSSSIYENMFIEIDLINEIGKYVINNRIKYNYNKVVDEFNNQIKFMKKNLKVDIDLKLNYFYEVMILSKIYKFKTSKYLFRKCRDFHLNYFTRNRVLIFKKKNRFKYESEILNLDLIKIWCLKIENSNRIFP